MGIRQIRPPASAGECQVKDDGDHNQDEPKNHLFGSIQPELLQKPPFSQNNSSYRTHASIWGGQEKNDQNCKKKPCAKQRIIHDRGRNTRMSK